MPKFLVEITDPDSDIFDTVTGAKALAVALKMVIKEDFANNSLNDLTVDVTPLYTEDTKWN